MGLITNKTEEFISLIFAMLNGCLNITAIIILTLNMMRRKDFKGGRVMYLHLSDIMLVIHVTVRLVFNKLIGMLYALQFTSWFRGIACKVISFFLIGSIHCSSATVLVIVIEWFIITRFPFEASSKVRQVRLLLNLYWVIPVLETFLEILFLKTNQTRCLFIRMNLGIQLAMEIVAMTVLVTITVVPPVLTVILSSLTAKLIQQSVIESGRKEDGANLGLSLRLVLINLLNLIRMFALGTLITIQFLKQPPADDLVFSMIFLGAHVPSTIHPLLLFSY